MKEDKKEEQKKPSKEDEKELHSIINNEVDSVIIRGKTWKTHWIRNRAKLWITEFLLNEKDEYKMHMKCVAALRLNGWWKLVLFHWILWRWYAYVDEYTDQEILPYLNLCKKKVGLEAFVLATTLLTEMRDTIQAQTREEVERFLLAQLGGQRGV